MLYEKWFLRRGCRDGVNSSGMSASTGIQWLMMRKGVSLESSSTACLLTPPGACKVEEEVGGPESHISPSTRRRKGMSCRWARRADLCCEKMVLSTHIVNSTSGFVREIFGTRTRVGQLCRRAGGCSWWMVVGSSARGPGKRVGDNPILQVSCLESRFQVSPLWEKACSLYSRSF